MTAVNILRLDTGGDPKHSQILWKNPASRSTRLCRPLEIIVAKEDRSKTEEIVNDFNEEMKDATNFEIIKNSCNIKVDINYR